MIKRLSIEVFTDAANPRLNSNPVMDALSSIGPIEPYTEFIDQGRKLIVNNQNRALGSSFQVKEGSFMSDATVLLTDRPLINRRSKDSAAIGNTTIGMLLAEKKLCVIRHSNQIHRTTKHEVYHFLAAGGFVSNNADPADLHHCTVNDCVMQAVARTRKRQIPEQNWADRLRVRLGRKAKRYEKVQPGRDFCGCCEEAIGRNAYHLALRKTDPALAEKLFYKDPNYTTS